MAVKNIKINAFEKGLSDLDEYLPCKSVKEELEKYKNECEVDCIEINLERCWLDYSFSYLYLDQALEILIRSSSQSMKTLRVVVSVDLGEPHFMAALLFPMSNIIERVASDNPIRLLEGVKKLCEENNLNIIVVSRLATTLNPSAEKIFYLGRSKTGDQQ